MKTKVTLKSFDLYTDGGVILKNPSPIGGTYAYALIQDDKVKAWDAGVYTPEDMQSIGVVTNNQTELLAVLAGVEMAHTKGWHINCLYCDSDVTLGRLFRGWAMNNIPSWLATWKTELEPVLYGMKYELVKGHADNKWNNYCDDLCRRAAEEYLKKGR